jgi:hypothetical protein
MPIEVKFVPAISTCVLEKKYMKMAPKSIRRIARKNLEESNLNLRNIGYLALNRRLGFSQIKSIIAPQIVTVIFNDMKS